jgi:periplasmic protein TonB
MPRDLFGDVTRPSISIGSRKWYTVPVSLLSHSLAVGLVIAVPILAPSMLPEVWNGDVIAYVTKILPPPPPPPIRRDVVEHPAANPDAAPTVAPTGVSKEREDLPGFENDHPIEGVVIGDVKDGPVEPIAPPRPSAPVEPVRVGGTIRPPLKVHDVAPVYSPVAMAARIEGIVILEATIGIDGQVVNARVLRSVPFLDQAALDAVRQWQFTPTLLNGVPVPVLMTVTVRFTLK